MPRNKSKPRTQPADDAEVVAYGVPRGAPASDSPLIGKRKLDEKNGPGSLVPPEPSLGDRLQQMLIGSSVDGVGEDPPKADNLAVLLEQGLKSADTSLLESVLSRSDEPLIRRTIELLPLQYVIPLIQHLGKMCAEDRPRPNRAPFSWLTLVLTIRSSYLTTLPDLADLLRNVYVHSDRRTKHTDQYVRLAGVINASVNLVKQRLTQRTAAQPQRRTEVLAYNEPLDGMESDEDDENADDSDEDMLSENDSEEESDELEEPPSRRKKAEKAQNESSDEEAAAKVNGNPETDSDDESCEI